MGRPDSPGGTVGPSFTRGSRDDELLLGDDGAGEVTADGDHDRGGVGGRDGLVGVVHLQRADTELIRAHRVVPSIARRLCESLRPNRKGRRLARLTEGESKTSYHTIFIFVNNYQQREILYKNYSHILKNMRIV